MVHDLGGVDVVAVCDVDEHRARETVRHNNPLVTGANDAGFKRFPKARRYNDFRKLFDWEERNIDAVVVATPDHTHIPASAMAISCTLYGEPKSAETETVKPKVNGVPDFTGLFYPGIPEGAGSNRQPGSATIPDSPHRPGVYRQRPRG